MEFYLNKEERNFVQKPRTVKHSLQSSTQIYFKDFTVKKNNLHFQKIRFAYL